jgi:hypothetical protein
MVTMLDELWHLLAEAVGDEAHRQGRHDGLLAEGEVVAPDVGAKGGGGDARAPAGLEAACEAVGL